MMLRPSVRWLVACLAALQAACLQSDQPLPFDVEGREAVSRVIGPAGGVISLASGISLSIPAGAITTPTSLTVTPRLDGAFPGDAGRVVPGTVFDVAPAGVTLRQPARVMLRLPSRDLAEGEAVRVGVARAAAGRSDLIAAGSYDATAGLLTATTATLGPFAAVVADDAVPMETGMPPSLGGGSFATGAGGVAGLSGAGPSGPAPSSASLQLFAASCRPEARRCFSSGLVQVWASQSLQERLGANLVILSPRLEADLSFGGVGPDGLPTEAVGRVSIKGTLRAQLGQTVASYEVDESFRTGPGPGEGAPAVTKVRVSGNRMILERTTDRDDRVVEYGLVRLGTGRQLTLRVEQEVDLENEDGSTTRGTVILFVRLRG